MVEAPAFVSPFVEENPKKGVGDKTDLKVDVVLDETIAVFRYLTDKGVFERYYKGRLVERLPLGRSVPDDVEQRMWPNWKSNADTGSRRNPRVCLMTRSCQWGLWRSSESSGEDYAASVGILET